MTDELARRKADLEREGWTFIESPSRGEDHDKSRLTAPYTAELYRGGRMYRDYGHDLAQAVEAAEWTSARLKSLETQRSPIIEGLASTDSY